jgi:glycosyltransferase involved in cell wall biosynthesis
MPALNAARFIEAALRSLVKERDTVPLDIIVIDDGSTDDTRDIVTRLGREFSEIRLIPNARKGIAAGRNTGLTHAHPESSFISFLDADDLSVPGRIARQRNLLAGEDIDVVYGLVEMFAELDEATQAPAAGTPTRIIRGPYLQSSMYRAEAIRALGPFDESFRQGDDTEFVLRAIDHPLRLHLEHAVAAYYRRHDSNVTLNTDEVHREFRLVTMKWAVCRRLAGKGPPPAIFSELFFCHDPEQDFGR